MELIKRIKDISFPELPFYDNNGIRYITVLGQKLTIDTITTNKHHPIKEMNQVYQKSD